MSLGFEIIGDFRFLVTSLLRFKVYNKADNFFFSGIKSFISKKWNRCCNYWQSQPCGKDMLNTGPENVPSDNTQ